MVKKVHKTSKYGHHKKVLLKPIISKKSKTKLSRNYLQNKAVVGQSYKLNQIGKATFCLSDKSKARNLFHSLY